VARIASPDLGFCVSVRTEDKAILRRTGSGKKGIVGIGTVVEQSFEAPWSEGGEIGRFVHIDWEHLAEEPIIDPSNRECGSITALWSAQSGGTKLNDDDGEIVFQTVWTKLREEKAKQSRAGSQKFAEGRGLSVTQTRYERDPEARNACLSHHGHSCKVCTFNFTEVYGPELGANYIHVHHIDPASNGERLTDPMTDLIPVCPNCHAMRHSEQPPLLPDRLRQIIRQRQR
jgi:5-methylcytosine-specific restriction enzyme A